MRELFKPKEIQFQTKIIGKQIADDHRGDKTPIVMVGLLNGAFADRKSTRLNSSHGYISYAVFCLKKKRDEAGREPCR